MDCDDSNGWIVAGGSDVGINTGVGVVAIVTPLSHSTRDEIEADRGQHHPRPIT